MSSIGRDHSEGADFERHFSAFIGRFGGGALPMRAARLLARAMRAGHVCLDLRHAEEAPDEPWPRVAAWRTGFAPNSAFGAPNEERPLVLDDAGRLYLRRYWDYEATLVQTIAARCPAESPSPIAESDPQTRAIETAQQRLFTIISGGPGTGKTTTVLRVLERLVAAPGTTPRIALAAPTGKAAARLQESLNHASSALRGSLIGPASTLNRLLGSIPGSVYFRHRAGNPLPADLLVVDEASMVSLTMMAKVFAALSSTTRVILLGDRDQLSSVEAGAVLGDLADAASVPRTPLHSGLVVLQKNYRFGEESGIYRLCQAVGRGESGRAMELLQSGTESGIEAHETPSIGQLSEQLRAPILAGYSGYLATETPTEALERFKEFRVLCALRVGPYGVTQINQRIQELLAEEKLIERAPGFYRGLPILITENDYQLELFNGDVGIILAEAPGSKRLLAWFSGANGELRGLLPARLPAHEPAFAMTVHKSQGSEFEKVLLLLPPDQTPVLTRELVYTGLTRARKQVEVWFREPVLRTAIERRTQRFSGLRNRLLSALDQP